jgi:hypothetical protein
MKPQSASSAFLVSVALICGCGSKEGAGTCQSANVLDQRRSEARAAAKSAYVPPMIDSCPELDLPIDGEDTSVGLTEREYGALLRGANGNFFDDGTWWVKATPRGGTRVIPVQITAERCDSVTFDKFGYDYAFATPPLVAAPSCGRYLTGVNVGHQLGDAWPQIFSIEGSGVIHIAPLSTASAFGPFLRLPRDPRDLSEQASTLDRVDVVRHDGDSIELIALTNAPSFVSTLRLVLKSGPQSRLSVQLDLEPRAATGDRSLIAVAALSGWFSSDETSDFERARVIFDDGTSFDTALSDPRVDWGKGEWTPITVPQNGARIESLALLQNGTGGTSNPHPNVTLSNFQSSVPLAFDLALSARSVLGGNVIANLLIDSASATGAPISVSYLVTASSP